MKTEKFKYQYHKMTKLSKIFHLTFHTPAVKFNTLYLKSEPIDISNFKNKE